ncbi:MAG: glycosyltransferase family 1 protein [bacterium]|nr:glycosyltransferase family 1 protein [bacterium]
MIIGIDGRALQLRSAKERWSGVGQYTYHLLHALFALDTENEYVIWYNGVGNIVTPNFSEYSNVHIARTRWPNKLLNVWMKIFKYSLFPSRRFGSGERIGLFFMPNINFIALPSETKLVAVAHDLSFEHFPEFFSWKSRMWHKALNPRTLFTRADYVIAVSEHTKEDVAETYGIGEYKISVIYPGVNVEATFRSPQWRPEDRRYILYFGALEPRKNIIGIIEAFERLKPREMLVLAGLSTSYTKELKKRIAQSRLHDRIILKENPTEEEKTKLYAGAHVFVYPSYYEGFGFPPLEAMAAGVPVVASSVSSVSEICGDAALLVSPWSVQEIKDGMKILIEDEEMRKTYITAGYARVKEFSWEQSARKVKDIFHSLA